MGKIASRTEARLQKRVAKAMQEVEEQIDDYIVDLLSEPYPPASSPGDSPHRRTGKLLNSVTVTINGDTVHVACTAPYAAMLEYGTSKMAARPFMAKAKRQTTRIVRKAIRDFDD